MKWEYIRFYTISLQELEKAGRDGWELAGVWGDYHYFKRPLKEEVPEEVLRDVLK